MIGAAYRQGYSGSQTPGKRPIKRATGRDFTSSLRDKDRAFGVSITASRASGKPSVLENFPTSALPTPGNGYPKRGNCWRGAGTPLEIKKTGALAANDNFAALAEDWLIKRKKEGLAETTIEKYEWFVKLIGRRHRKVPVKDIGTAEVLRAVRRFETRGRHHSAKRYRATLSSIFKYGIACGRAERDPAADISKALISAPTTPRPAITAPSQASSMLLQAIDGYEGSKEVRIGAPAADACFLPPLRAPAYGVGRDRLRQKALVDSCSEDEDAPTACRPLQPASSRRCWRNSGC